MEETLFRLLSEHVYTILFVTMIFEFLGMPIPGETMMVLAGVMGYSGHANYWLMIIATSLGTILGMQLSFEVGRRLGTKAIDKYGVYMGLTKPRMKNASKYFNKYGSIVIIIAYYLPGVRHIMGYFAGITQMDPKRFRTYSIFGGILWVITFITLGYIVGPSWKYIFHLMHKYGIMLVLLGIAGFLIFQIYKKLGEKEFKAEAKLTSKFVGPLLLVAFGITAYLAADAKGPKMRDDIFMGLAIFILVIAVILFLKYTNKNKTTEKLLVVVDFQKDFVDGALGFEKAETLAPIIKRKVDEYREQGQDVIYTLDTHEEDYLETREGKFLPIEHCIKGTDGHKVVAILEEDFKDAKRVFEKDVFGSMQLAQFIEKSDYKEVEFCGLVSNICVLSNIVLTQTLNKDVKITVDLSATMSNNEKINDSFEDYLKALGVNVK
ncbi:MAG: isochorismatase family protein [Gemella sp.]|nr:isochorismatase family protein [Gemella sp.]